MTYKGEFLGRASTFANLPERKQAGLKVRRASQAIQCMVLCCKECMVVKLGDWVVMITLGLKCWRIRKAVDRSADNHQT